MPPVVQRSISWGAVKGLIVGGGGREHALAWKCAASPRVTTVLVAPGNAGTATETGVRNLNVAAEDVAGLVQLAAAERVDLTIIGPEAPLVAGVVDAFAARGLKCFGPSQAAARLEGSKAFAKEFLRRHRIPTASSATFTRDSFDAAWLRSQGAPLVVKASGLAAGKGVVIAASIEEAHAAVQAMFAGQFGDAGREVAPRITSAATTVIADPTRAAWAPTRPRRWSRRRCTHASCAKSSSPLSADWPPRACLTADSCTPDS